MFRDDNLDEKIKISSIPTINLTTTTDVKLSEKNDEGVARL